MTAPSKYSETAAIFNSEDRAAHAGIVIGRVGHRLGCPDCLDAISGGCDGTAEDLDRAIDAQLDLIVHGVAGGDERIALYLVVRAFGEAMNMHGGRA